MSAVVLDAVREQVLGELFARAGASGTDREAWLAERLSGITATEVRDLTVKGAAFRQELLELKRGLRVSTFTGNQYTAWGVEREPKIAAWVQARYPEVAPESRVFRHADNPRFLASPDGIGFIPWVTISGGSTSTINELVVVEIKTSKNDVAPNTEHFERAGYYYQMQWSMFVTGASSCLYVWEQHDNNWPNPMPLSMEPSSQIIARDDTVITELVALAEGFLAEIDDLSDPAADYRVLLEEWALIERKEARLTARKDELRAAVLERIGEAESFSLKIPGVASVSYYTPKPSARFDSTAFKAADPETYAKFVKTAESAKPILKISSAKESE